MKILYIDVNCKGSSTGQIVYSLFSNCKKNGIESAICYGRGPLIKEEGVYKFGLDLETTFHALMTRITGYTGCFSYFSTRRLIKYIDRFKPDIVHIHELHAYFVNIKQLLTYLKGNNIKCIFTNHCEFLYTGKCGYSGNCNRYTKECGECPLVKEYPKSLFFDRTKQMLLEKKNVFNSWNDIVLVSPSNWLKDKILTSFLSNKTIHVVHNGLNPSDFAYKNSNIRELLDIPKDNKIVMTVGYDIFSDRKGGIIFLEIAKKMIDLNITFVAVGDVNGYYRDNFKNVRVLPLIEKKEKLIQLYSASDCFVVCSKQENFPTTSIEAQFCGTKVVGFDVGGVKETIAKNNGCVVRFNDIDAITNKIQVILQENYSKNDVVISVSKTFSDKKMFDEYIKLYGE